MRTILMAFVTGVLAVSSANATWISMKFADDNTQYNGRRLNVGLGQQKIDINVYAVMGTSSSDRISGVAFSNIAQPGLTQVDCTTTLPGWSAAGVNGEFGSNQFAVGADNPLENYVTGDPGEELLLGVLTVELYSEVEGVRVLAFDMFDTPMNVGSDTGLLNYNQAYGDYAGYWACGTGWPHGGYYTPPRFHRGDMLYIHIVPEPSSMGFLILVNLLVIRRRKVL